MFQGSFLLFNFFVVFNTVFTYGKNEVEGCIFFISNINVRITISLLNSQLILL